MADLPPIPAHEDADINPAAPAPIAIKLYLPLGVGLIHAEGRTLFNNC